MNSAKALFDNGAKIIGIAEKEGGIFSKKGIDIYQLEEYKNTKYTILNFPNTEIIKNSNDLLSFKCDILNSCSFRECHNI